MKQKLLLLFCIALVFLAFIFQRPTQAKRDQAPQDSPYQMGVYQHSSFEVSGESRKASPQINQEPANVGSGATPVHPNAGLVINPTFDTTITNNGNAAAIEAAINNAIAVLQAQFSDPITISILFRYSTTGPGGQPLSPGTLAQSGSQIYMIPWNNYINALNADAKTANDATANASLLGSALSTNVTVSSANGRALGLNTPGHLDSAGGFTGTFDGIVTLNSAEPFQFNRPPSPSFFDAQRSTEHEMDEVLGLGSFIGGPFSDLRPQDLFSWSAAGARNTTSTGSRYFSINGGTTNIVNFNQDPNGDFGDWLSGPCPQATPYVQNAFGCVGQVSDVAASSPEGINLDVIGYDLVTASSTIQFSSPTYSVNEGGVRVNITVNRSGDTSGSSSVNYQTIDGAGLQDCAIKNGIASPRCDYEFTVGTLTFAAGETSKSFSVAIIDDTYAEGPETFNVSLSNPSGATLGAQSTATVTIIDNDTIDGPTNPIDNTTFFVRQHYLDFLGREPDPAGPVWISIINGCAPGDTTCDRVHVSQNFFQSEEFQTRGYFIYRFYPVSFPNVSGSDPPGYGHKPDYMQFVPDLARVSGFLDANQLEAAKVAFIADFMSRPAFVARYGSLGNTLYVDTLLNTANVTVSASARQGWIDGLNNSTLTRAQVLRQIAESTEVYNKYFNPAFVIMQYFGYLRRDPDGAYLVWIQVLNSTNDSRGMITGFVNSAEYRHRFGP